MSERKYQDIDGNECSLYQMVKRYPDWAVSRIRIAEEFEAQIIGVREKALNEAVAAGIKAKCDAPYSGLDDEWESGFEAGTDCILEAIEALK